MISNILYIHHAGELGGAPKSLSILLNGLDKNKYKPYVFMLIDGPAKKLFEKENVEVIVNKNRLFAFHGTTVSGMNFRLFLKNILYLLPNAIAAFKIIKKVNPKIIHLNTSCLFVYAIIAKLFFNNIKVISHIREPLLNNFFGKILVFFNKISVDFFIPINNFESRFFNNKKLEVIKNSIDLNQYKFDKKSRDEEREKLGFSKDDFIIGYFARFNIENGIEDLLQISNKIDQNIKLLVFGYEPENLDASIKEIAEKMPKNVMLKGMIDDVQNKMQVIDILISPFKTPHFSRSVIEAQALSIPVLVSNIASQNTLLDDKETGYTYNFGDVDDAIAKIMLLRKNSHKRGLMKKSARKYAENNFCHVKNNEKVYSIYTEILNKK